VNKPGELPVDEQVIRTMVRRAFNNPWKGNQPLLDKRHVLDTTAILEPGRPTRILCTFDYNYHGSGWFKNSEFEQCLHVSVSHPHWDRSRVHVDKTGQLGAGAGARYAGYDLETPTEEECWEWGKAFFGEHAPKAWIEPAASVLDLYRSPNIVHLRLYYDEHLEPFMPTAEPYAVVKPWSEKVLGSIGGDVR
jgi:hypothetical protein